MLPLRENKKLVERPENEPKLNMNNSVDRKIIFTLIGTAAVILVLIVLAILLFFNV
ncbi:MAG: hypothetical protein J1F32_01505 [Erysipelotrichales bacterium]|nr:hypothetical protein [Erysipelotrichales bacterium]